MHQILRSNFIPGKKKEEEEKRIINLFKYIRKRSIIVLLCCVAKLSKTFTRIIDFEIHYQKAYNDIAQFSSITKYY